MPINESELKEDVLFRMACPVILLFKDMNPPIKPIIAKNAVVFFVLKKFSFMVFNKVFDLNILYYKEGVK